MYIRVAIWLIKWSNWLKKNLKPTCARHNKAIAVIYTDCQTIPDNIVAGSSQAVRPINVTAGQLRDRHRTVTAVLIWNSEFKGTRGTAHLNPKLKGHVSLYSAAATAIAEHVFRWQFMMRQLRWFKIRGYNLKWYRTGLIMYHVLAFLDN